jgi:hypothetical protein
MTDATLGMPPDQAGKLFDLSQLTNGASQTVFRQRINIGDPTTSANVAAVKGGSTAPIASDPALVVTISPNSPSSASTNPVGSGSFATSQASIGTSASLIVAARTGSAGVGRISVTIVNTGTATIYYGPTSGVTTSTGMPLGAGAAATEGTTAAIYGISATGTQLIGVSEDY